MMRVLRSECWTIEHCNVVVITNGRSANNPRLLRMHSEGYCSRFVCVCVCLQRF